METTTQAGGVQVMCMSEKIDQVAAALVAAQSELQNPQKSRTARIVSKTGAKFSYAYADLADVTDAIRPVFAKHGLGVMHLMQQTPGGFILVARLLHKTGQYIDSVYPVPEGLAAQDLGGWLTYMRRYSTCNLAFIAGETDDDGEAATEGQEAAEEAAKQAKLAEARKRLEQAKADGRLKSAHDGHTIKPGEEVKAEPSAPADVSDADIEAAMDAIKTGGRASVASLQRRLRLGYTKAARILDVMEERGLVGPANKDGEREILTEDAPDPTPPKDDVLIPSALANLMRRDGITPAMLKAYYVKAGHQPPDVEPADLPDDYVELLTEPDNWKAATAKMKGAK